MCPVSCESQVTEIKMEAVLQKHVPEKYILLCIRRWREAVVQLPDRTLFPHRGNGYQWAESSVLCRPIYFCSFKWHLLSKRKAAALVRDSRFNRSNVIFCYTRNPFHLSLISSDFFDLFIYYQQISS